MASTQQVAIPAKHLKAIRELKAALAANKTCMVDDHKHLSLMVMPKAMAPMMVGASPSPQAKAEEKEKQTTYTRSLIENLTEDKIVVHDKIDWSGRVIGRYRPIEQGKRNGFHHKGTYDQPDGSKGAVLYAGKARNNKDVAFLLAWQSGPYADAKNKVYVECGNLDDYKKINWDDIGKKLDATTESTGHCRHDKTGAPLSADIDPIGINPKLARIIDVLN